MNEHSDLCQKIQSHQDKYYRRTQSLDPPKDDNLSEISGPMARTKRTARTKMAVLVESTQRRCSGEVFDHPHGSGTMKRSFYPASDDIVSVKVKQALLFKRREFSYLRENKFAQKKYGIEDSANALHLVIAEKIIVGKYLNIFGAAYPGHRNHLALRRALHLLKDVIQVLGKHTGTPVRLWSYTVIENSQDTFAKLLEISSSPAESCFGKTDRPRIGSGEP
ncbi:hypothetical protein WN51_13248 [Melipona quadrifasciata]|uniref:Uncharacterized protein n=1 Tax=Melipona quadrifasciata TaxID=166423 RepID=A0A0M9A1D6_9HYME|nr:hypothetical protein WN51_13248 [Melipona quadrifasciata]